MHRFGVVLVAMCAAPVAAQVPGAEEFCTVLEIGEPVPDTMSVHVVVQAIGGQEYRRGSRGGRCGIGQL